MGCASILKLWKSALILFETWLAVRLEMWCVCQFLGTLTVSHKFLNRLRGDVGKTSSSQQMIGLGAVECLSSPSNRVLEESHCEQSQGRENNKKELYIRWPVRHIWEICQNNIWMFMSVNYGCIYVYFNCRMPELLHSWFSKCAIFCFKTIFQKQNASHIRC